MTVSCACSVVAVLVVVLCAGMSFDAGPKSSFLKYCGSCGQARCCLIEEANNGKLYLPVWSAGPENDTLAKQWDTGSWACRGIAPGSYLREISGRELCLRGYLR